MKLKYGNDISKDKEDMNCKQTTNIEVTENIYKIISYLKITDDTKN